MAVYTGREHGPLHRRVQAVNTAVYGREHGRVHGQLHGSLHDRVRGCVHGSCCVHVHGRVLTVYIAVHTAV